MEKGSISGFETQYRRRDGQVIDVCINAHIVQDVESEDTYFEWIIEDVTEIGFAAYLTKPVKPQELSDMLDKYLLQKS